MFKIGKDIGGAILAGGRGRRLGYPKSLLRVGGERVIDRVVETMKGIFDEVLIVVDDREQFIEPAGVSVVEDLIPGQGPLAAIYTALKLSSREKVFVAAGDMPFLQADLIRRLLTIARREDCDCVIPRNNGGYESLHAVYSSAARPAFERALKGDDLSVWAAFSRLNTVYVDTTPVERQSFFNINTPEDLKLAILNK
ncbi:MAG TPA: molybdenum cofactor guanylyltransferase [Proteobacteria bacterium]|nr:molybdenum cofactor guanylyltransferase [Pseudomonadota bacterium]